MGNTTGASNVAVGNAAGKNLTTGSNNIDIASNGLAAEAGRIRIGTPGTQTAAFLAGVSGVSIPGPAQTVVVNASGQLGTATSGPARSHQNPAPARLLAQIERQAAQLQTQSAQLHAQSVQLRKLTRLNARQRRIQHLAAQVSELPRLVLGHR